MQYVKYNPTDSFYKSVVGAVKQDEYFTVKILIAECVNPSAVTMVVYDEAGNEVRYGMQQTDFCDGYQAYQTQLKCVKGLYWYYFAMDGVTYEKYIGMDENRHPCLFYDNVRPYQLSVYKCKYPVPKWLNDGVMYQIMVDRFCKVGKTTVTEDKLLRPWGEQPRYCDEDGVVRNRDFFGGNLKGVTSKLEYLASLNVKTVYLNPIFKAYSNHKYDTEDYEVIDSMFGTEKDFAELCSTADKLGIKIILDGVFNHVGASSKYFNKDGKYGIGGAYNDCQSPYRDWFNFVGNSYESWWGFDTLPRLNAQSKSLQNYLCGENGIVPRWLKAGASGYRLDVVDEVADCMLDKIVCSAKKAKPDCAIIGEVWEDASNKIDYGQRRHYLDGTQLDSVMNYPLMNGIIDFVRNGDTRQMSNAVFDILNNYPLHVRNNLMNILGTHDTARLITNLAGDQLPNASKEVLSHTVLTDEQYAWGCKLQRLAVVLQYTFFGFPCVYYGDETSMQGYRDPFCRGCFPWDNVNTITQQWYVSMGKLRNLPVFRHGDFVQLTADNGVYAFSRSYHSAKSVVVVNRSAQPFVQALDGKYKDALTNRIFDGSCTVLPNEFAILLLTK